jgi:hypothetical protein
MHPMSVHPISLNSTEQKQQPKNPDRPQYTGGGRLQ